MGLPNNRKTIAFLIDELIGQYQSHLWHSMVNAAKERDINLICFPGRIMDLPEHHLFRHSSVYELISQNRIDGLIATTAIYSIFHTKEKLKKILDKFSLPYVSIGVQVGAEPVIQVDNKHGMRELVDHFIEAHNYKRIAFIRGPESNTEAELRYSAYKESLAAHGIPLDELLVETGSFWGPTGAQAVERLLSKGKTEFDALIAANDDMALAALDLLEKKGYKIPGDIGVGGFDNIEEGHFLYSPLTSVAQPTQEQAEKSIDLIINMIDGKSVEPTTSLSAYLLVKRSCGCSSLAISHIKHIGKIYDDMAGISDQSWQKEIRNSVTIALETSTLENELKEQFTDMFIDFILNKNKAQGDEERLISLFHDVLSSELSHKGVVGLWNQYLSLMYNQVLTWFYPDGFDYVTSSVFQKLRILVAEVMELKQGGEKMAKARALFDIQYTGQNMNFSFDYNVVIERLIDEIPRLNIKSFYVCMYDIPLNNYENEEWVVPETSELHVAFNTKNLLTPDMVGMKVPVKQLVSDKFLPADRRVTYVVKSLFFMDKQFGYIILEYGLGETILYETLRGQTSSLLHASFLFKEKNE